MADASLWVDREGDCFAAYGFYQQGFKWANAAVISVEREVFVRFTAVREWWSIVRVSVE